MTAQIGFVLLIAYFFGALPSAVLVSQFIGKKEIWQSGDGNMGAKNTFLTVGKLEGVVVGIVDIFKGAIAVQLVRYLNMPQWMEYLAGALAVLGHDFSIFVGFRGGQGMATLVGVFAMIYPLQTAVGFVLFTTTLLFTHHWDLSCFLGFGSFTGLVWITGGSVWYPVTMLPTIGLKKMLQNIRARHVVV